MFPPLSRHAFVAGLALFVVPLGAEAQKPRTVNLTLLHTNDTHGHLLPFSYPATDDPGSPIAHLPQRLNIGGAARRATLVNRIRAERGRTTLLLDGGDICDGTPFSTEYHGDADIAVMNAIGYDFACPGNHEFNNTLAQVEKMRADARFPLLCANVRRTTGGSMLYQPYVIKEIGGARVAIFGLTTYDGRSYPAARDVLSFQQPIEAARELVPQLRKQADFVVAVTHIGVAEDQRLATSVPGIDVIIGGHSHSMVPRPLHVASPGSSSLPSTTIIAQAHQWGGTLGRLDLTLEQTAGTWRIKDYKGALLPVTSSVPEDPRVAAVVAKYWDPIKEKYGAVVGQAGEDFTQRGADEAEYHLVADAVREALGADVGIENMGGVRAPLIRGPITYGDMVTLDPFPNTIVTFRATGRQLMEVLQRARPAVSGIRYVVEGDRLVEATINGRPIEDDRVYTGTTNSYMAGIPAFRDITDRTDTKRPRLDTVVAHIKAAGTIRPKYDGRRIIR
jgi:2',3'-cyclic-nucleotide 2'-phosphodiesterase (5'-nucleotidase family)